jgi:hypothetical protein
VFCHGFCVDAGSCVEAEEVCYFVDCGICVVFVQVYSRHCEHFSFFYVVVLSCGC